MLFDFERNPGQSINQVFYPREYANWRRLLLHYAPLAFPAIWAEIDGLFSTKATDPVPVITVSWVPGSDWTGTVYDPIYWALRQSPVHSAQFLGLMFMDVAIHRPENWGFGHYELNGKPIEGRTYFLLHQTMQVTASAVLGP
jgi:hypothetical protein